jgi:uncharacterized membrane protein
MYFGVKRRSIGGAGLAALGGELLYRGVRGHCKFYQLTGIYTADRSKHASVPYPAGIRVERSVTINRPPEELFRFWRDVENLPRFMQHLDSVKSTDSKRSHWVVKAPAGRTVAWDAEIINEKENELIGWRSLPGSDVESGGSVHFEKAPSGRGTIVKVTFQYNPPGGLIGAAVAKLFGEEPEQQVTEDLRRFKQLMEAGEVPTTEGQPSGRAQEPRQAVRSSTRVGGREAHDLVEHASAESFPASDAPNWTGRQDEPIRAM